MKFLKEMEVDAARPFALAKCPALAAAKVPAFVAADVETLAAEVGQEFVVEPAKEGQGARMGGGQRGRVAQEGAATVFVGLGRFCQFRKRLVRQEIPEVSERILVGHEVDAEGAAAGVQLANLGAGQCAPILPDRSVFSIGEGVLGVELEFVDFEVGEAVHQVEQGFELWDATARDVQHHAAPGEIGIIGNM